MIAKKIFLFNLCIIAAILIITRLSFAQGPAYPYSVVLTWSAPTGTAPASYNMYRAPYSGTACGTYAVLNPSPITSLTYTDATVTPGAQYCYETTSVAASGAESGPDVNSNNPVSLPPAPPQNTSATIK